MFNVINRILKKSPSTNTPQFMIIGAQKAGTTSLFDTLNNIKGFSGSNNKEIGFFSTDSLYNQGNDWYLAQFKPVGKKDITFEATPEYLYYDCVPKRIYHFNPKMKFIILFREPSERCLSAWNMFKTFNKNNPELIYKEFVQHTNPEIRDAISELLFSKNFPSFKEAVFDDLKRFSTACPILEPSFVRRGLYSQQLINYLEYFDISNFLFLEQNELAVSSHSVLNKIGKFLEVNVDLSSVCDRKSNVGLYDESRIDEITAVLDDLKEFYRPYNENLFELIGQHYNWND